MPDCPNCGRHLMHPHRTPVQKIVYAEIFRCKCGYRLGRLRPRFFVRFFHSAGQFVFSRYTRCIKCGTDRVQRISKRDRVDSMSKNAVSRILQLSGAPLNKCISCRLQYYDWRPVRPRTETTSEM